MNSRGQGILHITQGMYTGTVYIRVYIRAYIDQGRMCIVQAHGLQAWGQRGKRRVENSRFKGTREEGKSTLMHNRVISPDLNQSRTAK